jgi:hypothetical protein
MPEIPTREPELFASGDSLVFTRTLPGFLASEGWSLHYTLTAPDGTLLTSADSTADGDAHSVNEDNWAADIDQTAYPFPLEAVLAGFALKDGTNERHQIYYGQLTLTANLADATTDEPVESEAQEMIRIIRASLKDAYAVVYKQVDIAKTSIIWADIKQLRFELAYWKEVRRNEIEMERARNGKSTGRTTEPVFMIG